LSADLEPTLRALQGRKDIIRSLNQRRMEGAREIRLLGNETVQGHGIRSGVHDERGVSPFVVMRDREGIEHYARLSLGKDLPEVGAALTLAPGECGATALTAGRGGPEQTRRSGWRPYEFSKPNRRKSVTWARDRRLRLMEK